jgi:hypothetical protein
MIVINLYGGPGVGKTTQGLDLTAFLKKKGVNASLIAEYAKELVYRESKDLTTNQISIFNNQLEPYRYLDGNVDVVVAECPLILGIVYNRFYKVESNPYFEPFVMYEHNKYDNIDIYLKRENEYKKEGRGQDLETAIKIDSKTVEMLNEYKIEYVELGLNNFCENVYSVLKDKL